ncbi:unnamed protein product [Euphydryas editha]|uniref:Reverse transcriptase domain-containing protein n=1 Tax=Euphydryas editha TaxID=104508 RepID=A0AAU9ULZ5_EUPED|nr:unnamed protein product [Euphydryas editha]
MDVVSTGQPTYWPSDRSKIPDLIDFCVTKGITRNNISCNSCWDLSSDHSPIIINIQSNIKVTLKKCTLHNKKTNWILFRYLIDEAFKVPPPLKTEDDITNAVEFFNRNVQNAAWNSTPLDKYKSDAQSVAPNILDIIKEKRKTRKLWQQNRCPDTKKIFNHKVRELKQLLERDRNASFQAYLEGLDATAATDYSLWKATKKIKRPIVTSSPLRKLDLSWARSDQEKATTFAEHLEKVFQPHPYEGSPEHEKEVIRFIDIPDQDDIEPDYFTKSEVENIIKKANSKKAPGYDLITNKVLQELPDSGITLLTAIYNAITKLKLIPPQWKVAQIIMLLKPNKQPEDPKSYRPISLLPIPSKIYESLISRRLTPLIEQCKLIPKHQFGFRRKHATIEQVHRLISEIDKAFEAKKYCAGVFLDISQAFDRVWHEGLLFKLKSLFPTYMYKILKSFLENRHFLVQNGEALSSLCPIKAGVPQGSVLGSTLYLIYTSDLPTSESIITGTFADDTAILAAHSDPVEAAELLQCGLNDISIWLKKWRIKANETKSVNVTFTLRRGTCPPVKLNNLEVPQSDHVRPWAGNEATALERKIESLPNAD